MTTQTDEWEKEFEDSFGLDHPIRTFRDHDDYLLVRDFIRTLLTQERTRILAKVEEWARDKHHYWHLQWEGIGGEEGARRKKYNEEVSSYMNSLLDDLLHHLQQLKATAIKR